MVRVSAAPTAVAAAFDAVAHVELRGLELLPELLPSWQLNVAPAVKATCAC
jgi:hypothetical protein